VCRTVVLIRYCTHTTLLESNSCIQTVCLFSLLIPPPHGSLDVGGGAGGQEERLGKVTHREKNSGAVNLRRSWYKDNRQTKNGTHNGIRIFFVESIRLVHDL
jgi:hypothetical protein